MCVHNATKENEKMSYIYGHAKCPICQYEFEYTWLFPDCKAEAVPDKKQYIFAEHDKYNGRYHIWMSCPKCTHKNICYEYNLEGKLIEHHTEGE